ncbi:flp pilus-assembly TadE/G-like family protein [Corynebacterium sp. sy039]|nr:flp pilus-assembly TadE/G-like family protein [Corynebacterium sp. sy039]
MFSPVLSFLKNSFRRLMQRQRKIVCNQDGNVTIVAIAMIFVCVSIFIVCITMSTRVIHRHQAKVIADVSAVAGAYALYAGNSACDRAEEVAHDNDALLVSCVCSGEDVEIGIEIEKVQASSRAGPVH